MGSHQSLLQIRYRGRVGGHARRASVEDYLTIPGLYQKKLTAYRIPEDEREKDRSSSHSKKCAKALLSKELVVVETLESSSTHVDLGTCRRRHERKGRGPQKGSRTSRTRC